MSEEESEKENLDAISNLVIDSISKAEDTLDQDFAQIFPASDAQGDSALAPYLTTLAKLRLIEAVITSALMRAQPELTAKHVAQINHFMSSLIAGNRVVGGQLDLDTAALIFRLDKETLEEVTTKAEGEDDDSIDAGAQQMVTDIEEAFRKMNKK